MYKLESIMYKLQYKLSLHKYHGHCVTAHGLLLYMLRYILCLYVYMYKYTLFLMLFLGYREEQTKPKSRMSTATATTKKHSHTPGASAGR